ACALPIYWIVGGWSVFLLHLCKERLNACADRLTSLGGKRLCGVYIKTTRNTFASLIMHLGKDEIEELPEGGILGHAFVPVDEVVTAPERHTQHLRISTPQAGGGGGRGATPRFFFPRA